MTTPTERLKEAVDKYLDLVGQREEAREALAQAKLSEDQVRAEDTTPDLEREAQANLEGAVQEANREHQEAVAQAEQKLQQAKLAYERKLKQAAEKRDRDIAQAEEDREQRLAPARQEQEMRAAEARAEVHSAQQKVADLEHSMERHRRHVKDQLGVDLSALVGGPG